MTSEEAIEELEYIKDSFVSCTLSYDALDMAIRSLEAWDNIVKERKLVESQPTADVVEVVRCKDCKHYRASKATRYGRPKAKVCTRSAEVTISEEGFCSFGERKDDKD